MATKKAQKLSISKWCDAKMHLRDIGLSLGATEEEMAKACGCTVATFRRWGCCTADNLIGKGHRMHPRGYNRRRDVLRDLARFVALKAGEA